MPNMQRLVMPAGGCVIIDTNIWHASLPSRGTRERETVSRHDIAGIWAAFFGNIIVAGVPALLQHRACGAEFRDASGADGGGGEAGEADAAHAGAAWPRRRLSGWVLLVLIKKTQCLVSCH